MKVLQVINAYYPPYSSGGPAFVTYNISKMLVKRGYKVTVYTTNALSRNELFYPKQSPNYSNGVEVYYFGNTIYKPSTYIYFSKELIEAIKKNISNYDVIHLHEYRSYISLVINHYAQKYDAPYILQAHGQLPKATGKRAMKQAFDALFGRKLLKNAFKVIALNRMEAEQYKAMGVLEEKIAIIPNGIDLSEYTNLPPKGSFKSKYNIPEDKKIILYLGRIHRIKGIDLLIKAYAYLVKKTGCKDAILVIAGPDDGYLNEAKALAKSLKIDDSVIFTGSLYGGDKLEAYVDAGVYVLPSRYETFPMTVLEAYACGKPVIVSNVGGLKDLVVNGETGLLFELENIEELSRKLYQLLHDDYKTEEMGRTGRSFVEKNFMIEKVVSKLEKVYEEVYLRHSMTTITSKHEF
ncbi:MAG: glycosyltransferase [Nitrososphaeria archaeon]